jgi:pseudouridine synthase
MLRSLAAAGRAAGLDTPACVRVHVRVRVRVCVCVRWITILPTPTETRINKCLPAYSRRAVDAMVAGGRVAVNGAVALLGQRLLPGDLLALDGKAVPWERHARLLAGEGTRTEAVAGAGAGAGEGEIVQREGAGAGAGAGGGGGFLYLKCWKPRGVHCTARLDDPTGIMTHFQFHKLLPQRVFTIGRLDKDSSGLILLTSDGKLVNQLLGKHCAARAEKGYLVTASAPVSAGALRGLTEGVNISLVKKARPSSGSSSGNGGGRSGSSRSKSSNGEGDIEYTYQTLPCVVERVQGSDSAVRMTLLEGKNRQIRKMFATLGLDVLSLHRENFAGVTLGGLKAGRWDMLSAAELGGLRRLVAGEGQGEAQGEGQGQAVGIVGGQSEQQDKDNMSSYNDSNSKSNYDDSSSRRRRGRSTSSSKHGK